MSGKDVQLFLTLMDTVHDYGNTNRVKNVLNKRGQNDANNANAGAGAVEDDALLSSDNGSFNPAFLIDFLMLGYIHPFFKSILGLDARQHYLKRKKDCADPTKNFVRDDSISRTICEKFYFPTYAERVIFRSLKPEDITKAIVFDHIKNTRGIVYDDRNVVEWDERKRMPRQPCCTFVLGKKLVRNGTGIFGIRDTDAQGQEVYAAFKSFFGAPITYVTDANKMNNEWFCVKGETETYYKGAFMSYDSFKQGTKNVQKGGGNYDDSDDEDNVVPSVPILHSASGCVKLEYQEYDLSKSDGELLFLEKLFVRRNKADMQFYTYHHIKGSNELIIDTGNTGQVDRTSKDPTGLSLFLLIFNEINKKTLGFKSLNKQTIRDLKDRINKIGLRSLKETYKITLTDVDEEDDGSYVKLSPEDFVLALLDFKRSMDYLYVKAAAAANATKDGRKYVFVSSDRSAICYALYLGVPCALTQLTKGVYSVVLYNPDVSNTRQGQAQVQKKQRNNAQVDFFAQVDAELAADAKANAADARNAMNVAKTLTGLAGVNAVAAIGQVQAEDTEQTVVRKCREFMELTTSLAGNTSGKKKRMPNPFTGSYIYSTNKKEIGNIARLCDEKFSKSVVVPVAPPQNSKSKSKVVPLADSLNALVDRMKTMKVNAQAAANAPQSSRQAQERARRTHAEFTASAVRDLFGNLPTKGKLDPGMVTEFVSSYGLDLDEFVDHVTERADDDDPICKKILKKLPKSMVGGDVSGEERGSLLAQTIYLDTNGLEFICEVGSPMHTFFHFYAQLDPEVPFFWFIVFKSLLFFTFGDDMDKASCRVPDRNTSKKNSVPPTTFRTRRGVSLNGNASSGKNTRPLLRTLSMENSHGFPPLNDIFTQDSNSASRRR
jgi:hypothetical protein